jgi:predicted ArsR family transcriptional regulator
MRDSTEIRVPGLGQTQRELLQLLKRRGPSTTSELAESFDLASGTLREHLKALEARRLLERVGTRREGPGRPHFIYGLTDAGEALFPQGEAELLVELVEYLLANDRSDMLVDFFEKRVDAAYSEAAAKVERMVADERRDEAVRILTDAGFMPELEVDPETGEDVIRLCNCPLKSVIAVTRKPCRAEERLVSQLLNAELERIAYMPDGDDSCSYRIKPIGWTAPQSG